MGGAAKPVYKYTQNACPRSGGRVCGMPVKPPTGAAYTGTTAKTTTSAKTWRKKKVKEFYELLTRVADMILKNGDEVEITCEHEDEDSNVLINSTKRINHTVTLRMYKNTDRFRPMFKEDLPFDPDVDDEDPGEDEDE